MSIAWGIEVRSGEGSNPRKLEGQGKRGVGFLVPDKTTSRSRASLRSSVRSLGPGLAATEAEGWPRWRVQYASPVQWFYCVPLGRLLTSLEKRESVAEAGKFPAERHASKYEASGH